MDEFCGKNRHLSNNTADRAMTEICDSADKASNTEGKPCGKLEVFISSDRHYVGLPSVYRIPSEFGQC